MSMGRKRVVTGVNAGGKSIVSSSGPPPTILGIEGGGMEELWKIDAFPHRLDETLNPADRPEHTGALDGPGAWFRIVTFAPRSSYPMHTTNTLDFVVVLSGSVRMLMEEGEVTLYPGDSVVQRDTLHAWANDTDDACVVAGVLISNDAGRSTVAT
jgi:quercetin dioxygenase-like cupin family protein